jgi:hypothetical protein
VMLVAAQDLSGGAHGAMGGGGAGAEEAPVAAEHAAAALANLCTVSPVARDAVREEGGVKLLVAVIAADPAAPAAHTAAMALRNLCNGSVANQVCATLRRGCAG